MSPIMSWWMLIENPKKNTHNIHMNEGQNEDFKNMFIKHNFFNKINLF